MRQRDKEKRLKQLLKKVKKVLENPSTFDVKEAEKIWKEIETFEAKHGKYEKIVS